MTSFEVFKNSLTNFIHKVSKAPSKCLAKRIRANEWGYFNNRSQDIFVSLIS